MGSLDAIRQVAAKAGRSTAYDRHCRHLPQSAVDAHLAESKPYTIRLAVPAGQTTVDDLVYGHITYDNDSIDDQILLKSDGFPTYHFANVVDDHMMAISHVLRGEEWLVSTAKHLLLYQALKFPVPEFAHLPLLRDSNKRKLSKRSGAMFVSDFAAQGVLPSALVNFVAQLGWSPSGKNADVPSDGLYLDIERLAEDFDLADVNRAPAIVEPSRLAYLNAQHLHLVPPGSAAHDVIRDAVAAAVDTWPRPLWDGPEALLSSLTYQDAVLGAIRSTYATTSELVAGAHVFWCAPDLTDPTACALAPKLVGGTTTLAALREVVAAAEAMVSSSAASAVAGNSSAASDVWKPVLKAAAAETGLSYGVVARATRFAVSGETAGPDVNTMLALLGPTRVARRVLACLALHDAPPKSS